MQDGPEPIFRRCLALDSGTKLFPGAGTELSYQGWIALSAAFAPGLLPSHTQLRPGVRDPGVPEQALKDLHEHLTRIARRHGGRATECQ